MYSNVSLLQQQQAHMQNTKNFLKVHRHVRFQEHRIVTLELLLLKVFVKFYRFTQSQKKHLLGLQDFRVNFAHGNITRH